MLDEVDHADEAALFFYREALFVGDLGDGVVGPDRLAETLGVEAQPRSGFGYVESHLRAHQHGKVHVAVPRREVAQDGNAVVLKIRAYHLLHAAEVQIGLAVGEIAQDYALAAVEHPVQQ